MHRSQALVLLVVCCFGVIQPSASQTVVGENDLVTRLSYQNTYPVDWRTGAESPRVCLAIYRSGFFQFSKTVELGTVNLQGQLAGKDLLRIGKMLQQLRPPTERNGVVLNGSESFTADVTSSDETRHLAWVNSDDQTPFPASVHAVVDWLQDFRPKHASELTLRELSDHPVCPAAPQPPRPIV